MYGSRGKQGFTLVELIVVITIVGILSTVGFVSYSNYLTGARDSNRISQLVKLTDSLQVYGATKSLPLPDNKVDITASGVIIGYQGEVGVNVLETIDFSNGGLDPKDKDYFTYYTTSDRSAMQLLTFMEDASSTTFIGNSAYAVDYTDRFPKVYGKKLGVMVSNIDATKNTPAQSLGFTTIDLVLSTGSYVSYISDSIQITGTGLTLRQVIPNANCNRIKQVGGGNTSGIYDINPGGTGKKKAFCDMEVSGGGWTLIARSVLGATGGFALNTATGSIQDLTRPYIFGTVGLTYTDAMFASYTSARNIDLSKTLTNSSVAFNTLTPHTMTVAATTGGSLGDGYNGKAAMMFVK